MKLDGQSLVPLLKKPGKQTGRAVLTTQGKDNHAIRSDRWRYIRYADGSEELYDQKEDPENFHNLAGIEKYSEVKEELSAWFPVKNAEKDPAFSRNHGRK